MVLGGLASCALRERDAGPAPEGIRGPPPSASDPLWIWTQGEEESERAWFRREFELDAPPEHAELSGSADNAAAVYLNGKLVAEAGDWAKPFRVDVTRALRAGPNVLAAACRNEGGPAAFWIELVVTLPVGLPRAIRGRTELRIASDEAFLASTSERTAWSELGTRAESPDWSPARVLGPLGIEPWGAQADFADGSPARALTAEELELTEGFRAELLYSVPRALQGSWVAMTFDDRGRLITSDQYGPLYRLTLGEGAPRFVESVEEIELPIGEAHGLCYAFGALYAVVSSDRFQSGLYRLRDQDGDDRYDSLECLKEFEGSGEHGPHGVVAGPPGVAGSEEESLYVVIGNHTELPDGITRYRMPPVWGEDQLLPREPDPGGHAVGKMAPGGVVLRTDKDGKEWELVAGGLRNAYDLAFDEQGELFTFDSDMEWDVGLPWYRPTRILHVVSGADFGWRNGSGKWPADYPDTLPSVVDLGRTSPTGMAHGSRSSFPGTWKQALFVADWQNGVILAVDAVDAVDPVDPVDPVDQGNALVHQGIPFARGRPLPVTDLEFGPDGALYFVTGGRNTQSGVYRITADSAGSRGPFVGWGSVIIHAAIPRRERRWLEEFHGRADPLGIGEAWPALDHVDLERAHAARTILEGLPRNLWNDRALAEERPAAAIRALLALVREGTSDLQPAILARVLELLELGPTALLTEETAAHLRALEREQLWPGAREFAAPGIQREAQCHRLALLRILELAFIRMGKPEPELAARIQAKLQSMFPNEDPRLDRELVQLLVYLESPGVIEKALALIDRAPTQEDAIASGWPLRVLKRGWTKETRLRYFRWLIEVVPTYKGGESFRGYMDAMLGDAQSCLSEEDLDALALELPPVSWRPGFPNVTRPFVRAWTMNELLPELARLTPERADDSTHLTPSDPASPVPRASSRDFERGAEAFGTVCLACHRIGDEGGSTGPDLTGAGGRFSARDLLESIVEPSRTVSDQYRDQEVWTTEDRAWVGRIIDQDDSRIVVRTTDHEVVEIAREEIAEIRPHPLSRMPEGLLDTFDANEVLDLLAYVLAGGNVEDPAFATSED